MVDETEQSARDESAAIRTDGPLETRDPALPPLAAGPASLDPLDVANHNASVKLATLQELGLADRRRVIDTRLAPEDRARWTLGDWRNHLALHHSATPQRAWLAESALATVESGFAELAKLGHSFRMVEVGEADVAPPDEWPKMVYHGEAEPVVVNNPDELKALGDGWSDKQVERKVPLVNRSGDRRTYDLDNHPDAPKPQVLDPGLRPAPFGGVEPGSAALESVE
jgi:hypothetical protein